LSDTSAAVGNERSSGTITLNHTIVPATTRRVAPIFCAHFWSPCRSENAHFAPVRINDMLTLLFDDHEEFESHHYAFHVRDAKFDAILPLIMDVDWDARQRLSVTSCRRAEHRLSNFGRDIHVNNAPSRSRSRQASTVINAPHGSRSRQPPLRADLAEMKFLSGCGH
jgi:hypothetical protein